MRATLFLLTFLLILGMTREAGAVRPLFANIATVAGDEHHQGYQDGSFDTALFNTPLGLAISTDGDRLFVADEGNNRIRVIHLDENNRVDTLAGLGPAGKADGPSTIAQFSQPCGVLCLPGDRLLVNDFGNHLLRLVDLKAGAVTTFAGGSAAATLSTGPKDQVSMAGVQGMAYMAGADSVFFTQPGLGTLKAVKLETGLVTLAASGDAQIPHPAALWCQGKKLYVADQDNPKICEIDWKENAPVTLLPTGLPQAKVVSLCTNDNILYGLLGSAGFPIERFTVDARYKHEYEVSNTLVAFRNSWGDAVPPEKYFPYTYQPYSPWAGFVPDPSDSRKFYVSDPGAQMIYSVRDLFYTGGKNSKGLEGPEFPIKKPKNTFRILVLGDSRVLEAQPFPFPSESHPVTVAPREAEWDRELALIPQIERELNFQAALEDVPVNFEVLNYGRHGDLLFWPALDVPEVARTYDVDLVVEFSPNIDRRAFMAWYDHALTPDGIPKYPIDPEYILKPPLERIPDGLPREFYDFCKARNLVSVVGRNLVFDEKVMALPECHDMILEFYGKAWDVLNRKLSGMTASSGKPVKFLVLLAYTGREGSQKYEPDLYTEVANKYQIPLLNLNPVMNALHLSYYPLTGDETHLNPDGCVFFGRLLAHELVKEKLVPWKEEPGEGKP